MSRIARTGVSTTRRGTVVASFGCVAASLLLGGCFVHCGRVDSPPPPGNAPDEFARSDDQSRREAQRFEQAWRGAGQAAPASGRAGPMGAAGVQPLPAIAAGVAGGAVVGGAVAGALGGSAQDAAAATTPSDDRTR